MRALKLIAMTLFMICGMNTYAKKLTCYTPRKSQKIVIQNNRVSFSKAYSQESRDIASVHTARTKNKGKGFTKLLFIKGQKHIIHVENKADFSQTEDYMIVRSKEGHEMTYPLQCEIN